MTRAGERLLRGARQVLAYAQGHAEDGTYRVHNPEAYRSTSTTARNTADMPSPIEENRIKLNGNTANEQSTD